MGDSRRLLTLSEVVDIIHRRSIPEPNSGCLLWEGGLTRMPLNRRPAHGNAHLYGYIRLRGKMALVHRVMFEGANGPIPEGMQVLHRCDVSLCCNPAHLFLGTNDENHADKAAKDRGRKRLTHAKALEIHKMVASGATHTKTAVVFGVRQSTVSRIIRGERRPLAMSLRVEN